jgi:hypothetical protein
VNLFLDTSVVLAACGSTTGLSSEVFRLAPSNGWSLIVTPYVTAEVEANLPELVPTAHSAWDSIRPQPDLRDDVFTIDRPSIFGSAKDRPILFSALARADVLLTLDCANFGPLMSQRFYGLHALRPGTFLENQRAAGMIR